MGNSVNDLMYRYFREFKNKGNKLPVELGDGSGGILILGSDGTNPVPIPVRVDDQGRLMLASSVNVDVGDIEIGTVLQGNGDPNAVPWNVKFQEPQEVTLTGQMRGLASERPAPSPENKDLIYWSTDTGDVSVSTGTTWRHMGVA